MAAGGLILRTLARIGGGVGAFAKSKAVRSQALTALKKETLKAAATAGIVEGFLWYLDKKDAPDRPDDSYAAALKAKGIDPEAPVKEEDLPKILEVLREMGASDDAVRRFVEAYRAEKALDAGRPALPPGVTPPAGMPRIGDEAHRFDTPGASTMRPQELSGGPHSEVAIDAYRKQVTHSLRVLARHEGLSAAGARDLVGHMRVLVGAPLALLDDIVANAELWGRS